MQTPATPSLGHEISLPVKAMLKAAIDSIPESAEVAALTIPSQVSEALCDLLGGGDAAKPAAHAAFAQLAIDATKALRICAGQS